MTTRPNAHPSFCSTHTHKVHASTRRQSGELRRVESRQCVWAKSLDVVRSSSSRRVTVGREILLCVTCGGFFVVIADLKAETGWVDVLVTPEEEGTEDGLGHDIEHAIEGGFGVGRDDVASFRETPGDGVEEPEEDGPDAADEVDFGHVRA